ncbi:U3 small nucleolar RNA-associated protein 18 homolog [Pseudorasbora parva]|uniref:U3 small nucleolar RNA-associated protein 18 homolog n=1 Tax=Pseudorasbora parva TaxID=51549 RepID=UPI00351EFE55
MDPPETFVRRPRRNAKKPQSEGPSGASEERDKQQEHAALCATLGGEDASVRRLEELVFGAEERLTDRLAQDSFLDDDDASSVSSEDGEARQDQRRAVWEDEDDELEEEIDMTHRFRRDFKKSEAETKMTKQKLQQRLKEQFQRAMGGRPSWAEETVPKRRRKAEDEDEGEELLRRTGNFIGSSHSLPKGQLQIKKCLNANSESPCDHQLTTVQFHPSAQIVMTAALDHSVSLFQVDGKSNPKIQTIHLENFPVKRASFSSDGEYIVATGFKNKLFYIYDMMEGKITPVTIVRGLNERNVSDFQVSPDGKYLLLSGSSGALHLMTTKSREVIRSMKMDGNVCAAAFTTDGSKIFANSEEGEVFVWDVRSSKCLRRFADDGCVRGTALALSRDGSYLACGSQAGVVNIYSQQDCLLGAGPKPLKSVMNLLTPVTSLCFNHSDEILAIASRTEDEANRLVHLPSFTVFSNFPQFNKKTIFQCRSLDFSPRSGFYSVANNKGQALLFRLLHYKDF